MVESLAFVQNRLELAGPNGFQIHRTRCQDRTVAIARRWMAVGEDLKAARAATMTTLEARPGKGDSVSLVVMDRPKFDHLQEMIRVLDEQLAALEGAIKKLDAMGDLWYSDLEDRVGLYGRTELQETQQIARMSAAYIQKGSRSGKTPDEILTTDPEFQRLKAISEEQISTANKQLEVLRPKLEEVDGILKAVGC